MRKQSSFAYRACYALFLTLLLSCWNTPDLSAQTQRLLYSEFTETRSLLPTPDGGFVLAGRTGQPLVSGLDDATMAKIDPDGSIQWQFNYGGDDAEDIVHIAPTITGAYAFTGFTNSYDVNGSASDVFVGLVQEDGTLTYAQSLGGTDSDRGNGIVGTNDGGVVVTGCLDCFGQPDLYLTKLNAAGGVEWAYNNYNQGYEAEGFAVVQTSDGGFVITGTIDQGNGDLLFLLKTDSAGNELWQQVFGGLGDDAGYAVHEAANGDLLLAGISFSFSFTSEDVYLIRTNANGEYKWHNTFGEANGGDFAFAVEELPNGEIVIAGSTWSYGAGMGDVYLIKADANGNEVWSRTYGTADKEETGRSLQIKPDGTFLIAGIYRTFSNSTLSSSTGMVIHADENGLISDNYIQGNVFHDISGDCGFQGGEPALADWLVQLEGNETYYTTTDTAGNYEFVVPAGNYELSLISETYNWNPCLAPFNILVQGPFDTLNFDLPVFNEITGPYLEVDISAASVTACSNQTYYINYCNKGTTDALAAKVELMLDPYFSFLTSSIPVSNQSGLTYTFNLGNVNSRDCGTIEIEVAVDCSAPEGITHCMGVSIVPDDIQEPIDPSWDGASLAVEGYCNATGDTVVFEIRNVGANAMSESQNYVIIEDDLVFFTAPTTLEFGAQEIIKIPANGKTYRMEIDQSNGHPGRSMPSTAVEACGTDGNGNFSLGYVTQFAEDDADFFVSIDCQENAPNFAPFDKRCFPKGTGAQHFIEPNEDLEYHIRFQNILTDTVATIVIRDTLSPFLDITSVRPGASSHPYDFEIYGNGIVKFTFTNIQLLPANSHPGASVGFVKFRVGQQLDNPPGTVINNSSAIYLDYHLPAITPVVFRTIKDHVVYASTTEAVCYGAPYTEPTALYDTLQLPGYDSITITQVNINPIYEFQIDTSICAGEVFSIGPYEYSEAGFYTATFETQDGCDSLYNLHLTLLESPEETFAEEICEGDSLIFGGNIYTTEGQYIIIKEAANGCDSSVYLTLKVNLPVYTEIDTALAEGSFYDGILIKGDTTIVQTFDAANGCDSIVTIMVDATIVDFAPLINQILQLEVFPNPMRDDLHINYQLPEAAEVELRLYHSQGQLAGIVLPAQRLRAGQHHHCLSLSEFSPGTYLLWIRTSEGLQIRKVIKWD